MPLSVFPDDMQIGRPETSGGIVPPVAVNGAATEGGTFQAELDAATHPRFKTLEDREG
jgi:hypothetical protein